MKRMIPLCLAAAAAVCVGCATTSASDTKGHKITIVKPMDQTLKRGETNKVAITVLRENLSAPLEVKFSNLPPGMQVVEKDRAIHNEETIVSYTLYADNKAALVSGNVVRVTVTAPDGLAATAEFNVTVME